MKKALCFVLLLCVLLQSTGVVLAREVPVADPNDPSYPLVVCDCFCTEHQNGTDLYIPGDLTKDGDINALDALMVLRSAVGMSPSRFPEFASGKYCCSEWVRNVDTEGGADAKDALELLKYSVGKVNGFTQGITRPIGRTVSPTQIAG